MDDKRGDNVIELKPPRKLSILEMLSSPSPRQERPTVPPGPRPGGPPAPPADVAEEPASAPEPREQNGLDLTLPDLLDPLPLPGDPYKAHARASNKPLLAVYFLLKDGSVRGFSYETFDSIDRLPSLTPGGGPVVVVRFAGLTPSEVRLEGRDLGTLFDHIGQHRILWIRERGKREFQGDTGTVVTGVTITPLA